MAKDNQPYNLVEDSRCTSSSALLGVHRSRNGGHRTNLLTPPCSCEPHSPLQNELWGPTLGLSRTQHACEHITHSSNHSPAPVPRSNRAYHGRHAHGLSLLTCQAHRAISTFSSSVQKEQAKIQKQIQEVTICFLDSS